jgi:hypothetical protein
VPLNTDDNMLIELRAPNDLIGFARYAGYLQLFYGESWPYGELSGRLTGLERPGERARMVFSLLSHGRYAQARRMLTADRDAAADPLLNRASRLLLGLSPGPVPQFDPPAPGPGLSQATRQDLARSVAAAHEALARRDEDTARKQLERIAAPLRRLCGPGLRFLYGDLLRRTADGDPSRERAAIDELEALLRDEPEYAVKRPETLFSLAQVLVDGSSFDRAARTMLRYAELVPEPGAPP